MKRFNVTKIVDFPRPVPNASSVYLIIGHTDHDDFVALHKSRYAPLYKIVVNDSCNVRLCEHVVNPMNPENPIRSIIQSTKRYIKWPRRWEYECVVALADYKSQWESEDEDVDSAEDRAGAANDEDDDDDDDDSWSVDEDVEEETC